MPVTQSHNSTLSTNAIAQPISQQTSQIGPESPLANAERVLRILETKAAAYTSVTIPPTLQIELEDKRKEVEDLKKMAYSVPGKFASETLPSGMEKTGKLSPISRQLRIEQNYWQLPGGDKRLSSMEDADIAQIQDMLKNVGDEKFGAKLLEQLLINYQNHRNLSSPPIEPSKDENIKFFDLENILRSLRKEQITVQLVELSGPSGIGKTHTLKGLSEERDKKDESEWGKWKYAYVKADDNFDAIMSEFVRCLKADYHPDKDLATSLATSLWSVIEDEKVDHIVFILDEIDKLSDDVLFRLAGDEGPVGSKVRDALTLAPKNLFLRMIMATRRPRFPRSLRTNYRLNGILQLQMDALGFEIVQDMLQQKIMETLKRSFTLQQIEPMARAIFEISGGHPGMVDLILRDLAEIRFVRRVQDYQNRYQRLILQTIQHDIIGDLSLNEYLLYNVLSVFRSFSVGLIPQLLKDNLLPKDLIPDQNNNIRMWLDSLCETPALIRKTPQDYTRPFSIHPVLRHILPLDLQIMSQATLQTLHIKAHQIYDRLLQEDAPGSLHLRIPLPTRPVWTMEALYHLVQSQFVNVQAQDSSESEQSLIAYAKHCWELFRKSYQEHGCFDNDPLALWDCWEQDADLQTRILRFSNGQQIHQKIQDIFRKQP